MSRNTNTPKSGTTSPRPEDGRAPPAGPQVQEEELGKQAIAIRSINFMEEFSFVVTGEPYDEWMPRISRNGDGTVPVLPCTDLDTGEECLFILPGLFNSWMRRNRPARGTKLRIRRKGKDPETGAWLLTVARL